MDSTTYTALREDALAALADGQLVRAMEALRSLAEMLREGQVRARLEELRDTYSRLLAFFVQGMHDPDRQRMTEQFVCQTYEMADVLHRAQRLAAADTHYASIHGVLQRMGVAERFADNDLVDCSPRQLFESAWTSAQWTPADYDAALALWEADCSDAHLRLPLLLSGVTLAQFYQFDAQRLRFLLTAAESPQLLWQARALVGIALTYLRHSARIQRYPALMAQTQLLLEQPSIRQGLVAAQCSLLLTLESGRIERSLREDIIPEVMKQVREAKKNAQRSKDFLAQHLSADELLSDAALNPEWDKDGKPSVFGQKMRELHEMQRKGADIFMSSFKMFKQNFPFFSVAANWFYPYTTDHPDLKDKALPAHFDRLFSHAGLCDSDRYSMSLLLAQMPMAGGPLEGPLGDKLKETLGSLPEATGEAEAEAKLPDAQLADALRICIQDMYRFCKLFRHRDQAADPFTGELLLTNCPPFDAALSDEETLERLANFTFEEKHYAYALAYLQRLPASPSHLQKAGYAHQMLGEYAAAIEQYEHALYIEEHSAWTMRQLAICLRLTGQYDRALPYLEQLDAEAGEATTTRLLLLLADTYMRLEQYDRALERLFKADYLFPGDAQTIRALAWCSLLTGKYEQAERYYNKLETFSAEDLMNLGHLHWLSGNLPAAADSYLQCLRQSSPELPPKDFFAEDAALLSDRGIAPADQRLMQDYLYSEWLMKE